MCLIQRCVYTVVYKHHRYPTARSQDLVAILRKLNAIPFQLWWSRLQSKLWKQVLHQKDQDGIQVIGIDHLLKWTVPQSAWKLAFVIGHRVGRVQKKQATLDQLVLWFPIKTVDEVKCHVSIPIHQKVVKTLKTPLLWDYRATFAHRKTNVQKIAYKSKLADRQSFYLMVLLTKLSPEEKRALTTLCKSLCSLHKQQYDHTTSEIFTQDKITKVLPPLDLFTGLGRDRES